MKQDKQYYSHSTDKDTHQGPRPVSHLEAVIKTPRRAALPQFISQGSINCKQE